MNINEKSCYNCKYFTAYYIKQKDRLYKTFTGFCSHTDIENGLRRKFNSKYDCDCWQSFGIQVEERRTDIKKSLLKMQKNIEEILIILKDDKAPD